MNAPLLSRQFAQRLRRLMQTVLGLVLLLAGHAAQAQDYLYGLGTVSRNVAPGNFIYPLGATAGDQGIVAFFTVNRAIQIAVLPKPITGLVAGQRLVGMDFRTSTGQLYALGHNAAASTDNARLYTLDPTTGLATPVGAANITLALGTAPYQVGFDFNPVADQIRVVSPTDFNYRLDPATGALLGTDTRLAYAPSPDPNAGKDPGVTATAYSNAFIGSTSTTLYGLDVLNGGILTMQAPPASGTLNTRAMLSLQGFGIGPAVGLSLDIYNNGGTDKAFLVEITERKTSGADIGTATSNLYVLDLATGLASDRIDLVPASAATPFDVFDLAVPPLPTLTALAPNAATVGGPGFTLTATGTGFLNGATVLFNGSPRTTTYVSATQLTAFIPAADLASLGTFNVTVANPNVPGGTTGPVVFTVTPVVPDNPVPAISSLSPASATAGAPPQTLTVNGSNFLSSSVVRFGGSARATTFVSATQLTIGLTAADQATPGAYGVTVTNPAPGGGTSAPATFTVNPAPVACNAPTGLSSSAITSTSATVGFTGSGSATGYTVTTSPATTSQNLPGAATSVNFTGLTPGTAYTVSIVSNCAGGATSAPASIAFTTGPVQAVSLTWTGAVSAAWADARNWDPAQVPTVIDNIRIPNVANDPVVSTAQQGLNLSVASGATLTLVGTAVLDLKGVFLVEPGSLFMSPAALISLTGPAAVEIAGGLRFSNLLIGAAGATINGPVEIQRVLTLNGNLGAGAPASAGLVLLSDAQGTALVVNNGTAVVSAQTTVQRYIDPTPNGSIGYRHYSSPVAATSVADLSTAGFAPVVNPAYNTVGNTVTPFPNVFGYDETRVNSSGNAGSLDFDKGFFSPTATTDVLEPTRGYTVNIAAQATVDFVGTLNNGPLTAGNLTRGSQTESGWHLRGNPYPAPLNWASVVNSGRAVNIENALYVYKSDGRTPYSGSYASYINGQATNSGTNVLPVAQGFFVRTAAGQTGSIAFTNADRLTAPDATPFQRGTADLRPQLALALSNAAARTQAVVYFEQGATPAFDKAFDARALPAPNGLTLGTATADDEALAINGQPALTGADVLLPLRVAALTAGTYTLAVDKLENLPLNYRAYLRDGLTGTYTDLGTTPAISLTLSANGATGGRYAVLFTTQARVLATAPAALARLASVYPNPARGTATLLLPNSLRGPQATAVSVTDNVGRVVLSRTLAAGATETLELPLGTLAPGVYTVLARTAAGLVAKRLVVE